MLEIYQYFFYNCFLITMGYGVVGRLLSLYCPKFNRLEKSRRLYIIKNIIKSVSLGYLVMFNYGIFSIMLANKWDNESLYRYASNFVANDFMGLLLIRKLPLNTKLHHITSVMLLIYLTQQDFNTNHAVKLIITYGAFSTLSFIVNLYLGLRYIVDAQHLHLLRIAARYIYQVSCILNISAHAYLIMINHYYTPGCLLYLCCLVPIINDDLILIRWLKKNDGLKKI